MRVSLEWLNEYVDIAGLEPKAIAEALTNAGLEVESIETTGGQFSGVVVGYVEAVEQHPNADRLRLVNVDIGPLGKNRVVCGAPNVAQGMRIAYAQIGAQVINRKEGGMFELKPAKIRGVESTGMICSIDELGLQDQFTASEAGIWPIDMLTTASDLGKDLKEALGLKVDVVLDVMPNANRGDLMSMWGVAREVAALFNRPLKLAQPQISPSFASGNIEIRLSNPQVCTYYAGALLDNITIGPSPEWMQNRLANAGIRAINNVVDITNYVMLEMGQPLHTFDAQKLGLTGVIDVRYARAGEKLKTLDGQERGLAEQSVIVTFNDQPVALAGVMGGEETEVDDQTQQVFLEAAFFPSATNRRSARSVGLRSESSARFERGVDPLTTEKAFHRAIGLLQEHAQARIVSITSDDHRMLEELEVPLSFNRMSRVLGVTIPQPECETILSHLGFDYRPGSDGDSLMVTIPSFRSHDVTREIDLIEEIIRIHGYDAIPYTLPQDVVAPDRSKRARMLKQVRQVMTGAGLTEVTTLSLIGEELLRRTGFCQEAETTVRVTNSHSVEHAFLRQSLMPTLLEAARYNQAQGNEDLWLFELGRTYFKNKPTDVNNSGVSETLYLGGLLMNHPQKGTWHQALETDFYTLKGVVENLLSQLQLAEQIRWMPEADITALHPGQTARLRLGKTDLGFLGRLHPQLQEKLKFKSPVYLFQLNLEVIHQAIEKKPPVLAVESLSAFPSVRRDIAFSAPIEVSHQQIIKAIAQAQDTLVQECELFDEYKGAQLVEGTRSLAYRLTLQSAEGTLTEADIEQTMAKIKKQLTDQLPVTFR